MRKQELYLILHNIRSAYNVGSIFRTADGAGVSKIYLCGITPTPKIINSKSQTTNHKQILNSKLQTETGKIAKTALGAEKTVPWEYHGQTWRLVRKLKSQNANWRTNLKIIALEQSPKSTNIFKFKPKFPLVLIAGNEVRGLNKKILSYANEIIEIPMHGKKESLNVAVATGIALYKIAEKKK